MLSMSTIWWFLAQTRHATVDAVDASERGMGVTTGKVSSWADMLKGGDSETNRQTTLEPMCKQTSKYMSSKTGGGIRCSK